MPCEDLVDEAVPLLRYAIDRRLSRYDLSTPDDRGRALGEAASVLASVKTSLLVHDYTNYLADRLFVDYQTVQRAVATAKPFAAEMRESESDDEAMPDAKAAVVSSPQSRAEAEYLGALAYSPRLRCEARFLLPDDLLTVPVHRDAMHLMGEHPSAAIEDLVSLAQPTDPNLASLLAGLPATEGALAEPVVEDLITKLKEFGIDRLILTKKSELKSLDQSADEQRYDRLFREISDLQREKGQLRGGDTSADTHDGQHLGQ